MKPCRWLLTLLAIVLIVGPYTPAQADWVDVSDNFLAEQICDGTNVVKVQVTNITEEFIEGELRLLFIPAEGTPDPINALTAGEDGSDPTLYYPIVSKQEGLIEPGEIVIISVEFEAAFDCALFFSTPVEVNDASIDNQIFRKKISKTPEFYSGEGGIAVMPIYVTAQSTSGEKYTRADTGELVLCGTTCDENGENCETITCSDDENDPYRYAKVKPLVVTYVQEEEEAPFNSVPDYDGNGDGIYDDGDRYAHDIYAAVSLDDGLTWKRRNISRTSLKSSFTLPNGVEYPGDSEDADLTVVGPHAFVTWTDKYCRSGDPWDLTVDGSEDLYQVTGSQKSVDYVDVKGDEDPRPDLGVRPFSCLWGARGVLDMEAETSDGEPNPNYGTIVWYKAEQLSTGRRDAKRNFNAGIEPVYDPTAHQPIEGTGGFAVSWQEDPKGLKTGKGRGPGAGMSGACVNHKTDIWYSYIRWSDFATIDADFVSNSDGDAIQDGDGEPMSEYFCTLCPYVYDPEIGDVEHGVDAGTAFVDLAETWTCPLCGAAKEAFEKDAKPHALIHFEPPVRVTDNAVCRERNPTEIMGHVHTEAHIAATGCDYYYEGGTTNQPLAWDDLPDEWECPKCGGIKDTFEAEATFIKYRNEGAPYCEWFASNPRVDGDGNVIAPGVEGYDVAYYTSDLEGTNPLDGNTGASRANLSLVNWQGETLALMAYEETKGVGAGSDKEAAAMEQAAPIPLVQMTDGTWEAGFTNDDCRSCHYQNVVPRDRVIPVGNKTVCEDVKGGVWKEELVAYFPYAGYPYITDDAVSADDLAAAGVSYDESNIVKCVKFQGGWGMYPRDYARIYGDNTYYNLPDHMPGWHQAALDCTGCHLPYNTKDHDQDNVVDRADQCLETPLGEEVELDATSANYGCSASQDPNAADNNKDEPDRFRHGKNIYYHHFAFNEPDSAAIGHGDQINGFSRDVLLTDEDGSPIFWSAPDTYDPYENARRVRVVPNADLSLYETSDVTPDANVITLGLLYKEGKDGQGAPADAILRLFKGGFGVENMGGPLNLSSSTPYLFQDPLDAGNDEGSGDNPAGDGTGDMLPNRNTPKIDHFYWTDANLQDPTGYWYKSDAGDNLYYVDESGNETYTPFISGNPFENVFSTRLAIHGDLVVAGYAYCVNWSAGKKAKDHYDFYIRVSDDAGENWTLPVNVSNLKNHEESVSDCRVILTPPTLDDWDIYDSPYGQRIPFSMTGAPAVESTGDFNRMGTFFVGVGTKENIPQPSPNEIELEESEVFLDTFYSQGEIAGGLIAFETYQKENPKYVSGSLPYLDLDGVETDDPCWEGNEADGTCVPNEPNPAFPELVDEFNWLAKGDANQGDIQMACNPFGSRLYTIWEQELAITDEDGQNHFQGADVWFRKVFYEEPVADMDVNEDGEVNWVDGRDILRAIGSTAYDADFLWRGDFFADHRITGRDFSLWKREFTKLKISQLRNRWTSK